MKPDIYLSTINKRALELQSIPTSPGLWEMDNFELFLKERRKLLAQNLNDFLSKDTYDIRIRKFIILVNYLSCPKYS